MADDRAAAFIPSPEQVSAVWLTEVLQADGRDVVVRGFEAADIGTGQLGRCIRYRLDLDGADASAGPRSVVGKFPSDSETSRQTGVELRNYVREVRFYQQFQQRLSIATPRCYFAEIEGEGPHFALLLADLAPAVQGNQIEGCRAEVAKAAVLELAGLHAPTWNDATLLEVDWLTAPGEEGAARNRELYVQMLPGFLGRYGEHLESDAREILSGYCASARPWSAERPDPFALIHIDYRLDNLLIDERVSPPAITAVDWQSIAIGRPLGDVSYFLGAGLEPPRRRRCEEEIVRAYHRRLVEAGIDDYHWDECWADYRLGTFAGFGVTVIASMLVQETERGNQMFIAMAQRHTRHALDLGADELL